MDKEKVVEQAELFSAEDEQKLYDELKLKSDKKKTKKKILAAIAIMCVVGIVSGVLLYFEPWASAEKKEPIGMYGSMKQYNNYPINYDIDVTADEEYMGLDRYIHFSRNGEEFLLEQTEDHTVDQKFFMRYFDTVINGRYEEYNAMFTDKYYETTEPYVRFTPQMVYDIHIEKLNETYSGGKTTYVYNVSYRIFKNNGTFRNDIGSDSSKTLYFELVEKNGEVKIDRVTYYV